MKNKLISVVLLFLLVLTLVFAKDIEPTPILIDKTFVTVNFIDHPKEATANIPNIVKESFSTVQIDSNLYPEFKTIRAEITFKNACYKNPIVLHDGNYDPSIEPVLVGLCQWKITVSGFSSWQIVDTDFNGTHNHTTLWNSALGLDKDATLILSFNTTADNITDWSNYSRTATVSGAIYNSTGGKYNGAYVYDGVNDYIDLGASADYIVEENDTFTVSAWVYPYSIHENAFQSPIISVGDYFNIAFGDTNRFESYVNGGIYSCLSCVYKDNWYHVVGVYNGSHYTAYLNGVNKSTTLATLKAGQSRTAKIGSSSTGSTHWNGTIDEVLFFNRSLSNSEIADLYTNFTQSIKWKYYQNGDYTSEVYNSTDYDAEIYANQWLAVLFPVITGLSYVTGRAGNTSDLSGESWVLGSYDAGLGGYTFNGVSGKYFQYKVFLTGSGSTVTLYENATINSSKTVLPWAQEQTITTALAYTNNSVSGQARYMSNDTDTGSMRFEWYVDGVNVWNETDTGLSNNSLSTSTLASSYFIKNQVVNFTATPIVNAEYGDAIGTTVWSNNSLTIINSNYTFTYTPSDNTTTYTVTKPRKLNFVITFTEDIDDDAVVTWSDGTNTLGVEDSLLFQSRDYNDYELVVLTASITDGEYNNTISWNVQVEPGDIDMFGSIGITIFILVIALGLFILPFKVKFSKNKWVNDVIRRGLFTLGMFMMMFNSSIMANIAEYAGLDLTNELFFFMRLFGWAGYFFALLMIILTLLDAIKLYKVKKYNERYGENEQ